MREIFDQEHEAFRRTVRSFLDKEVVPHHDQWEKDGIVSRDVWLAAGRQGLLGFDVPEEYGGGGVRAGRRSGRRGRHPSAGRDHDQHPVQAE